MREVVQQCIGHDLGASRRRLGESPTLRSPLRGQSRLPESICVCMRRRSPEQLSGLELAKICSLSERSAIARGVAAALGARKAVEPPWVTRDVSAMQLRSTPTAPARLAQSAERKALNLVVVGSSPTVGVHRTL